MRALILGGTSDANRLAEAAAQLGLDAIYSYAGRTQAPAVQSLPTRIGGFGGANGLVDYIRRQGITHVVDATHPFAVEMSRNAVAACATAGTDAYTLRLVDTPEAALPLQHAEVIVSRGPFTLAGDLDLMRSRDIEWIVARNAGGSGAFAKIEAARRLGLPVVMIARPVLPQRQSTESIDDVLAWLGHDARLGA